jgi:release factor glutamine methyltransferase
MPGMKSVTATMHPLPNDGGRRKLAANAVRRQMAKQLRAAGIENAELDARVLIAHVLGIESAALLVAPDRPVDARAQAWLGEATQRRLAGEPVARIVGFKEFWSRRFALGPETLVPRPETETVVEAALAAFPDRDAAFRVLDLGIGTGALLAAILCERPRSFGVGVDRSGKALVVARKNLEALGLGSRALLVCGDWGASVGRPFALVVANPPYVVSQDIAILPPEVRDYDPLAALDGGADGLDAYRAIFSDLPRLLATEGIAVFELGDGQEESVAALAREAQLSVNGTARRDLSGRPRALVIDTGRGAKKHLEVPAIQTSVRPGFDPVRVSSRKR